MHVEKKVTTPGNWAKLGIDYKQGDIIKLLDSGRMVKGEFQGRPREQLVFKAGFVTGEKSIAINQTSINHLVDAYGDDTDAWEGREVKVWVVKQNIKGKLVDVTYLTAPDQELGDE